MTANRRRHDEIEGNVLSNVDFVDLPRQLDHKEIPDAYPSRCYPIRVDLLYLPR